MCVTITIYLVLYFIHCLLNTLCIIIYSEKQSLVSHVRMVFTVFAQIIRIKFGINFIHKLIGKIIQCITLKNVHPLKHHIIFSHKKNILNFPCKNKILVYI